MKVMSIKVDEELHQQLRYRAIGANLSLSELVRPLLEETAWPGGRYVFTGQDELLGIAIQTFAMVTELTGAQSPALAERAMYEARRLMRERGLIKGDLEPVAAGGDRDVALRGEQA